MKSPAFQFYPGDWLSSPAVMLMTPEHEGAYIRLLCYDWMSDGIPDCDQSLAALSRLGEGWFKGGSTVLKRCFNQHPTKAGFLTNPRLQKEREKQAEWREKSRIGGIKSAASRSSKRSRVVQPKVNRPVEPNGNSSSSSSSSNTPIVPRGTDADFLEFVWKATTPQSRNRSSREKLADAWSKTRNKPDHQTVLRVLALWAKCHDWTKDGGQFAPGIHRWIKERKWESEPESGQGQFQLMGRGY